MKVFLSHSEVDSPWAATVSGVLEANGLEVWDPDRDVFPGDNWAAEMARALEEAEAMVVLLTPEGVEAPNVRRDMLYALGAKSYKGRLIPVVLGDLESLPAERIPWMVRRLPRVELDRHEPEWWRVADAVSIAGQRLAGDEARSAQALAGV